MKRFALSLAAVSLTAGALIAPALAESEDIKVDTQVVEIDQSGHLVKLANGMTLDQSIEHFSMPRSIATGDKVRLIFSGSNDLERVVVLR